MTTLDRVTLRDAYDQQLRGRIPARLPAGIAIDRIGPLARWCFPDGRGLLEYRDLGGLDGQAIDALIAGQREFFAARGGEVEWKYHAHDRPADLPARLVAAGFLPQATETVVIGTVASALKPVSLPEEVTLRTVTAPADFARIDAFHVSIWGDSHTGFGELLGAEYAADPEAMTVLVAEAGSAIVCTGWIRYVEGTGFATLWGGSTAPAWRRRGIYRALLSRRAELAAARGLALLQVDASAASRPILERLGFVAVTQTIPYVWKRRQGP